MKTADHVIGRLKEALGISGDSALAAKIGVARSTLANWRRRNSVPYEKCVEVALKERLNLDWVLTGEGPPKKEMFVVPQIDEDLLATAIALAERWPEKPHSVTTPELASLIVGFYTDLKFRFNELKKTSKLDEKSIIKSLRRAYGLPTKITHFKWWRHAGTEPGRRPK